MKLLISAFTYLFIMMFSLVPVVNAQDLIKNPVGGGALSGTPILTPAEQKLLNEKDQLVVCQA